CATGLVVGKGVVERRLTLAAGQDRNEGRSELSTESSRGRSPRDRERHEVEVVRTAGKRHVEQHKERLRAVGGQRAPIGDADRFNASGFAAEPTLRTEK